MGAHCTHMEGTDYMGAPRCSLGVVGGGVLPSRLFGLSTKSLLGLFNGDMICMVTL